jgi:hypothetical protein
MTMSHWLGGIVRRPSVLTNGSGGYTIGFTSNPEFASMRSDPPFATFRKKVNLPN